MLKLEMGILSVQGGVGSEWNRAHSHPFLLSGRTEVGNRVGGERDIAQLACDRWRIRCRDDAVVDKGDLGDRDQRAGDFCRPLCADEFMER